MGERPYRRFEGPRVVLSAIALIGFCSLGLLWAGGFTEDAVRSVLTLTIRAALLLFALVFASASIRYFVRTPLTLWVLRNRRYLGIAFASAFVMHFLAIGLRAWMYPDPFVDGLKPARVVHGGVLLGTVLLLALTSSDLVVARVRPALWRFTHLYGSYYIFYRFWKNYWSFSQDEPVYYVAVAVLGMAAGFRILRFAAILVRRRKGVRAHISPAGSLAGGAGDARLAAAAGPG